MQVGCIVSYTCFAMKCTRKTRHKQSRIVGRCQAFRLSGFSMNSERGLLVKRVTGWAIGGSFLRLRRTYKQDPQSFGVQVAEELRQYGVLGIKLGQILATRFDLVPAGVRKELALFYDQLEEVPYTSIEEVLQSEWTEEQRARLVLDTTPLSSASIAQVYRAKGVNGEDWVVKVVKPTSMESLTQGVADLKRVRRLMRLLPFVRKYVGFVDQLTGVLLDELNMLQEASNMATISALCSKVRMPAVEWGLTTKHILVMEYVEGVALNRVKSSQKEIANQLLDMFFDQVFTSGVYHADMHPGNIRVHGGEAYLIDFGMVGYLSNQERYDLGVLCLGFVLRDERLVTEGILGLCPSEIKDPVRLRSDIFRCVIKYTTFQLGSIDFESSLQDLLGVLGRHRIQINPKLTALVKTLVTLQGVVSSIDGSLSIVSMITGRQSLIVGHMIKVKGYGVLGKLLNT